GLAHVSLRALQRLADQNSFHGFQAEIFEALALRPQHIQSQASPLNLVTTARQYRTLDRMFQFSNIPRPGVLHEKLQRGRFEALNWAPVTRGITRKEMNGKSGDIFAAVAQRGHVDLDRVQPK